MVTFNELRISDDGKCIIVDVEISDLDIYEDMYIRSIDIDYYKNAVSSLPSQKAYTLYEDDGTKKARGKRISFPIASLGMTDFGISSFEKGLFYVVVTCDGDLPASIVNFSCGYDDTVKIGAILDWKFFYNRGMQYISSLYGNCSKKNFCDDPNGFEDFILLWNALKLALSTCDWPLVADIWSRITGAQGFGSAMVFGGCGCGR